MSLHRLIPIQSGQVEQKYLIKINKFFGDINTIIEQYNLLQDDSVEKFSQLQKIYICFLSIGHFLPQYIIARSSHYQDMIHKQLFTELKSEFQRFNVKSLQNALTLNPFEEVVTPYSLSEIIANLAVEPISDLLRILSAEERSHVSELVRLCDRLGPEQDNFRVFLQNHTFRHLGSGNSIVYEVTSLIDGSSYILKIEGTMQDSKLAADYFRNHSLAGIMSHIYAERQMGYQSSLGNNEVRNLLVLENMKQGNLEEYAAKIISPTDKIASALTFFERMATVLHNLTYTDHGLFSDMKITNWMVDEKDNLRISDSKSLCFSNHYVAEENTIEIKEPITLVYSFHMLAPEVANLGRIPTSIDKIHSYLLGKVLYQFLTGCRDDDIESYSAFDFNFDYPVFKLPTGKLLQNLILSLVVHSPSVRPSTSDIIQQMQLMRAHLGCYQLIDDIAKHAISNRDHTMRAFIKSLNNRFEKVHGIDEMSFFHDLLVGGIKGLDDAQPTIHQIRARIEEIRQLPHGKKRARELEDALQAIPVSERVNISESSTCEQVMDLINLFNSPIIAAPKRSLEENTVTPMEDSPPPMKRYRLFQKPVTSHKTPLNTHPDYLAC